MSGANSFILKPYQVPEHVYGEVHAHCAYCDYQTLCQRVAVCESCFGKRLKQSRPERLPNIWDIKYVPYKHVSRDGFVHIRKEEVYKVDFKKPAKYPTFACDCSLCGQQVWSEYTVPICKTCINSFQPERSTEPAYLCSVLTTRFPANTLVPGFSHAHGAILDVIPHIAACLLAVTAGDIRTAITALLNLMEAVQSLVSPHVIIGHIRTQSPRLYSAWHDFLLAMKYCNGHTSQTIPAVFGHVCRLSHEHIEVPDGYVDVAVYYCMCECALRHQFLIGSELYPPSRSDCDGRYRIASFRNDNTAIPKLIDRIIDMHYQQHAASVTKTMIYANPSLEEAEYLNFTQSVLANQHTKDIRLPKKKDRQTRRQPKRLPGKARRLDYLLGNYSLV